MKFIIINIALLLACIFLQARTAATVPIPNQLSVVTRYTGIGYNALYANPDGEFTNGRINPGIRATRFIFKHTHSNGYEVFYRGRRTQIPDQVAFVPHNICVRTESAEVYGGQASYKEKLSRNVEHSVTGM